MSTNLISIDVGSGYTKAILGSKHIGFPSVASPLPTDDFFAANASEKIMVGQSAWLIGESAINSGDRESRQNTLQDEWAGSDGWVALLFSALAKLGATGPVHLITGIPQAQFADKQRRMDIISSLKGTHSFQWMDTPVVIEIKTVLIIPQAVGAVLCRANQDESVVSDVVGIVDIGTYTTGLSVMRYGEFVNNRSGGHAIGVSDLIRELAVHLDREYHYKMDKADGPTVLMQKSIKCRGRVISLKEDIKMLAVRVAKPMLDAVDTLWDGGNDLSVYVSGGGAPYFIDALKDVMPHAQLMEDNFYAVARGMLLYLTSQAETQTA